MHDKQESARRPAAKDYHRRDFRHELEPRNLPATYLLSCVLAPFPAIRFEQHLPSALPTMPVGQHFPLEHLLGLSQDE